MKWTLISVSVWAGGMYRASIRSPDTLRVWLAVKVCVGKYSFATGVTSMPITTCVSDMRFGVLACARTSAPALRKLSLLSA